ncbi:MULTISPECIES: heptaprenylglyceryl phosphate O-acetyltransferase [unclassified Bacillus (in: firmicutes)]|uniref:heptaprenylglyceryl phosphate O-acetyltransferase n=1 Tax=unclassified Bacillus (in: firmicutes) TaxID=185979 RepID=UPI002280E575|nr:heptaprenylglyceryl phosphate O-acetyltransferase [Bacillus sp. S20C3]MCY8204379.1 heptaprenylglyceryl phosphate O-acetyltransferase [Bacillus sp. N12A5]MCY8288581.1 heptaprenylglyceryl phosphate O-acetyltransferase [Bacillus sp. N13C7]MCY8638083.1 heptaprenylglyceryl phosphate O-acetyltransferase [Bacillus sp. S17B2]MCY8719682.1 heptaprenylglyceryl phosphate O-acetyltransferase [Bacillus sp. S10C12M]MCY9142410.1 heptaprenylglyceryl phosphate O-acetyltransferase [Bacillus sp. T9C1]
MRKTDRHPVTGANSLWHVYQTVPFVKVVKNFIVIQMARYTPFIGMKNWLYRTFLRMKVGKQTSFALMVMPDIMFPEKISVGTNTIIGYNTTILAHEYLIHEYRIGKVLIGDEVMIGANTTILPGVEIGDGAIVSAGTLVHKDVPAGAFVGGNPMRIIYTKEEMQERFKKPAE